jgi:glycosyltransferase involved in cell wall biosynthesis
LTGAQTVSVVIPAYNEEKTIGGLLHTLRQMEQITEIVVVDDCSHDQTVEAARSACPEARIIQHPYNMGNGAAVKSGIRAASGDVIVLMDADGQHPPGELPNLLQHIGPYDMVVGARAADTQATWGRRLANTIFNLYATYIVGRRVLDLTSGFRAFKASIARSFVYLLPNGYSYPTTLTIAFFRAGYAVKYQPFRAAQREAGSRSSIRPLVDGLRFLLTLTRLAVLFVPLKIFLPVSLFLTLSGGGYVISQLACCRRFSGFGGLVTTIGIFIFMLGLIAAQIAMLRLVNSER